jgi:mono/diheme cytochrome c family protein
MARTLAALIFAMIAGAPVWAEPGATFRAHCGSCHGQTGRADSLEARALKVPPLKDYKRLRGLTAAEIAAAVRRNAKHTVLTEVSDADLLEAAEYVTRLVREEF